MEVLLPLSVKRQAHIHLEVHTTRYLPVILTKEYNVLPQKLLLGKIYWCQLGRLMFRSRLNPKCLHLWKEMTISWTVLHHQLMQLLLIRRPETLEFITRLTILNRKIQFFLYIVWTSLFLKSLQALFLIKKGRKLQNHFSHQVYAHILLSQFQQQCQILVSLKIWILTYLFDQKTVLRLFMKVKKILKSIKFKKVIIEMTLSKWCQVVILHPLHHC